MFEQKGEKTDKNIQTIFVFCRKFGIKLTVKIGWFIVLTIPSSYLDQQMSKSDNIAEKCAGNRTDGHTAINNTLFNNKKKFIASFFFPVQSRNYY